MAVDGGRATGGDAPADAPPPTPRPPPPLSLSRAPSLSRSVSLSLSLSPCLSLSLLSLPIDRSLSRSSLSLSTRSQESPPCHPLSPSHPLFVRYVRLSCRIRNPVPESRKPYTTPSSSIHSPSSPIKRRVTSATRWTGNTNPGRHVPPLWPPRPATMAAAGRHHGRRGPAEMPHRGAPQARGTSRSRGTPLGAPRGKGASAWSL